MPFPLILLLPPGSSAQPQSRRDRRCRRSGQRCPAPHTLPAPRCPRLSAAGRGGPAPCGGCRGGLAPWPPGAPTLPNARPGRTLAFREAPLGAAERVRSWLPGERAPPPLLDRCARPGARRGPGWGRSGGGREAPVRPAERLLPGRYRRAASHWGGRVLGSCSGCAKPSQGPGGPGRPRLPQPPATSSEISGSKLLFWAQVERSKLFINARADRRFARCPQPVLLCFPLLSAFLCPALLSLCCSALLCAASPLRCSRGLLSAAAAASCGD